MGGGSKCARCEEGWCYECARPDEREMVELDGSTFHLCCCHTLNLWFDDDGVERWPDGTPYLARAGA